MEGDPTANVITMIIFSPFPSPEWDVHGEDVGDRQLWEDNWDDDNVEDDFSCQLRWGECSPSLWVEQP